MPDSTAASTSSPTATTWAEAGSTPTELFEGERTRLFGLAYRMLGSVAEADDVVQDTWLRFDRAVGTDAAPRRPAAWLTTVATRLAIDRLRSAQHRREVYVGPWLPEPILTDRDPAHVVELDDTLRLAFLHSLERLAPVERAVFLLHDVFGTPFVDVAEAVDRSEVACRQLASRARSRVRSDRPRVTVDERRQRELLDAFLGAVMGGGLDELERLLTEDVVLTSDGGAEQRAARNPVLGRRRTARLMVNLARRSPAGIGLEVVEVNGELGMAVTLEGVPVMLNEFEFEGGLVARIHTVNSPTKLAAARLAFVAAEGRDPTSNPFVADPPHASTRRHLYGVDDTPAPVAHGPTRDETNP